MINVLKDKAFWLAILTIFALIMGALQPGYSLDVNSAVGMAVIAASLLIAWGLNPSGDGLIDLFKSRKWWAAIIGFLVLMLNSFHVFPGELNTEAVVGWVVIISWYIICMAIDPGAGWRKLMFSRKFWAALIGLAITMLQAFNVTLPEGITSETLLAFTLILTGAIGKFGLSSPVPEALPDPENGGE